MRRLYLVPVKDLCNASCSFCYMKEKDKDLSRPNFISVKELSKSLKSIDNKFDEVEITGGGDPILHPEINKIINLFPDKYSKMYTNGFKLKEIDNLNEINISRVHPDSKINNKFYNSRVHNELDKVLDFYRSRVDKIRMQTILLRGAIDSEDKALEFILKYEDRVDEFMFRTLFSKCSLEKENFVSYFSINHPKARLDKTLDDYSRDLFFVDTTSKIYNDFKY